MRAVLRVRARRGDVRSCRLVIQGKGAFPMQPLFQTRLYTFFQATVPVVPEGLSYVFEVETAKKVIHLFKHGVADTRPVTGHFTLRPDAPEAYAEPPDWVRDAVFYQIFPERFHNGDRGNDPPGALAWGQAPSADTFFGGDLKGILDRLDYLHDLGVNALYLNPIFDAASTHKYDTRDYLKVDPAFGDVGLLRDLVSACHEKGIRLILDGVFNHTGTPFFAFKDLLAEQESSPYKDWYFVHSYPVRMDPANYEAWWGISSLPKLNTANLETREYLLNVATHWIREAAIDGWRLDVPDEIPHDFWKEFRKRVRTTSSDAFVVGEVWFDGTSWLQGDQFDSVMNYRLRTHILDFFVYRRIQAGTFDRRVQEDFLDYRASVSHALLNLLGSHDTERILTLAKTDRVRVLSAFNFLFAFPGVPMVYYGDEVGLEGGKDPDCRRCMEWDPASQDRSLHSHIRNLIHLRRKIPALRRGDWVPLGSESKKGLVAYARCLQGQWVVAVFHNGPGTVTWSLPLRTPGAVGAGFKGPEKAPAGKPTEIIGSAAPKKERGFLHVTLEPWSSAWILLEDS
ncbi:MAG: glycoside hydrolase family 13 protein [Armatimonadetes bacterium]|nr:glycoside hydrolase family 13 protein [Armatimonadota bacterium]